MHSLSNYLCFTANQHEKQRILICDTGFVEKYQIFDKLAVSISRVVKLGSSNTRCYLRFNVDQLIIRLPFVSHGTSIAEDNIILIYS